MKPSSITFSEFHFFGNCPNFSGDEKKISLFWRKMVLNYFSKPLEANPLKALLTVIYKFVNSGFYKIPCSHKFCQIQQDYRCIHLKIPRSTLADELALVVTSKLKRPVFSNLKIPACKTFVALAPGCFSCIGSVFSTIRWSRISHLFSTFELELEQRNDDDLVRWQLINFSTHRLTSWST